MAQFQTSFIAIFIVSLLYLASFWISTASLTGGGSHIVGSEKPSAYECGFEPVGDARMKFEILYYVIGILYLIFDIELIFLFPLAAVLRTVSSLLTMWYGMAFLIQITIGFIYEYLVGALDLGESF